MKQIALIGLMAVALSLAIVGCGDSDSSDAATNADGGSGVIETVSPVIRLSGPTEFIASGDAYAINFGNVVVGTTQNVDVTIKNIGVYRLEIQKVELGAGTSDEFAFSIGTLPVKVEPSEQKVLKMTYTPSAPGKDTGAVELTTNAPESQPNVSIALTGNGVRPDIEVCTVETGSCNADGTVQLLLDFGTVQLGGQSESKAVTVANKGAYSLSVKESIVLTCPWDIQDCLFAEMVEPSSTEFVLDPVDISGLLGPGQLATLNVTYKPVSSGSNKSALRITSDDPDEDDVWVLLLGTSL